MKISTLMIAGLLSMTGAAFAQTSPITQLHQDNVQLRHDNQAVHQASRQIQRDQTVIAVKQAQLATAPTPQQARHDQKVIARRSADLQQQQLARHEARVVRHADRIKRAHDAAKV